MIKVSPHSTRWPMRKTKYANVYITTELGLSILFNNLPMANIYVFFVAEIKSNSKSTGIASNWLHPNLKLPLLVKLKN